MSGSLVKFIIILLVCFDRLVLAVLVLLLLLLLIHYCLLLSVLNIIDSVSPIARVLDILTW